MVSELGLSTENIQIEEDYMILWGTDLRFVRTLPNDQNSMIPLGITMHARNLHNPWEITQTQYPNSNSCDFSF